MSSVNNVVSIRAYKTVRECQKLFRGYKTKLERMEKADLLQELERYRGEAEKYPQHLLTIVKGEILMNMIGVKALSKDLRDYAYKEQSRLKLEIRNRLHTMPLQSRR